MFHLLLGSTIALLPVHAPPYSQIESTALYHLRRLQTDTPSTTDHIPVDSREVNEYDEEAEVLPGYSPEDEVPPEYGPVFELITRRRTAYRFFDNCMIVSLITQTIATIFGGGCRGKCLQFTNNEFATRMIIGSDFLKPPNIVC